jgi:hypothetical protein
MLFNDAVLNEILYDTHGKLYECLVADPWSEARITGTDNLSIKSDVKAMIH